MSNIIITEWKTIQELFEIQKNYLEEKLIVFQKDKNEWTITSRDDILSIFQQDESPILDTWNGEHMITQWQGEESMKLRVSWAYYTIEKIDQFEDALLHILQLENNPNSSFYKKEFAA